MSRIPLGLEAALALTVASLRVTLVPNRGTARLLGELRHPDGSGGPVAGASADAMRVGRAVERMAAVLPWHPVCLPCAVAVTSMLRRRRISCRAHLGFVKTTPVTAHAWVTVGQIVVQGAPLDGVTEVASFG